MELLDKDLVSIQAVRNLVKEAKAAQAQLATFSQEQLDKIVFAMYRAGFENAERLGRMANEETGFGKAADKCIKNQFASQSVYDSIKDLKTVGILNDDKEKQVMEVGVPIGVIAALVPSTNPTSTVIFKALIAIKTGNAIVFSPHPSALKCITETVRVMNEAAMNAGCPKGAIATMEILTMQSTAELMKHKDVSLILATGGTAMVKAAYSSGTPSIGVGPGNGPAFIEKTADIPLAVKRIIESKTFDNGTICASEQSVVVEAEMEAVVKAEFERQGGYFLKPDQKSKLEKILMLPSGTMNPKIVGKPAHVVAEMAGIDIPAGTTVLLGYETGVGAQYPLSEEKLCPVLGFYVEADWEAACLRSIEILNHEGAGHTMMIHTNDTAIVREFALRKPVSRLLVNTPGALGGIGGTTNLLPSLTLGCGAVGGSSTSDNIGPLHLINIRRICYGVRELDDIRGTAAPAGSCENAYVERIIERVLEKLCAGQRS